jgi:hypothetical protein
VAPAPCKVTFAVGGVGPAAALGPAEPLASVVGAVVAAVLGAVEAPLLEQAANAMVASSASAPMRRGVVIDTGRFPPGDRGLGAVVPSDTRIRWYGEESVAAGCQRPFRRPFPIVNGRDARVARAPRDQPGGPAR